MALPERVAETSAQNKFLLEQQTNLIDFTKDTCAIVGTTHKGPAFVPKSFIEMGVEKPEAFDGNLNTFARYFGNPTGSFNVVSNARLAASQWLSNSTNKQVSFIRVLGAGNGLKTNSKGIVEKAGFVVGDEQVSGTINHGKKSSNIYANEKGVLGRTFFLGGFYYQSTGSTNSNVIMHPLTESFEQCRMSSINGITLNLTEDRNGEKIYPIINGILMFPSGVSPGLNVRGADFELSSAETSKGFFDVGTGDQGQHIGSGSIEVNNLYSLLLNGHKDSDNNLISFNFNKNSRLFYYKNVFNTDPLKIEEKGHLLYAAYDPDHSFHGGLKHLNDGYTTFIVSSSLDRNTSNASNPNFEDFRARYRTASTPWVVSQTFSIQDSDRTNITGSINDLFKFYSRTDGVVGNSEVYTIIQPTQLGSFLGNNTEDPGKNYSKFKVFVIEINSNKVLEVFNNCNLHPRSENYIGKQIGSQYEYYNWEVNPAKQKVVTKGKYLNQSQYIRVEIHEDVENILIPPTTMPSGFRGYRHITTEFNNNNLLDNIASFNNSAGNPITKAIFGNKILQCPVPHTIQLKTKSNDVFNAQTNNFSSIGINETIEYPTWGINNRFKYSYRINRNRDDDDRRTDNILSPDVDDSVYFINNVLNEQNNFFEFSSFLPDSLQDGAPASWNDKSDDSGLDIDLYNNNLFHLEKIIVHTGSGGVFRDFINWNLSTYRRDGKDLNSMEGNTLFHSEFARYFNINNDLNTIGADDAIDANLELIANTNKNHLAFSVFLAGGFDGVNIFDNDKSNLSSDACVREENNELDNGDLEGPTIISYKRAANLITDENLLLRDIVCMPGIESNDVRKNNALLASNEKTYLYIQDIPLSNYNYEIVTGSKSFYMENFASNAGVDGLENQDETIVKATAEMHRRNFFFSSFNASYFGETKTTLLNDQPGGNIEKIIAPTINALQNLSSVDNIGDSPSGEALTLGSGTKTIINDFNEDQSKTDVFRKLYRSRDLNVIAKKDGVLKIVSARTEDDAKPSLLGAIGTRRALLEIKKRIRDFSIREVLFENYSSKVEIFVIEYNRSLRSILQEYVNNGTLSNFSVNIDANNMTVEDIDSGIVRGSVSLLFAGREDIGTETEEIRLDDIVGTAERLVN